MKELVISVLLVGLLAACASEKPRETVAAAGTADAPAVAASETAAPAAVAQAETAPVAAKPAEASPAVTEKAAPASVAGASVAGIDQLNDTNSILSNRSTHYPFDVSVVQEDDKPLVQAHASFLGEHPDRKVRLEGNCDERGSNEYNLALGQRRAEGVKKLLLLGGAKADQLITVSFGEEKPKAIGHDEASWKQNRRTDIVY